MQLFSLEQLFDADHPVKIVWQFLQSLDLTQLHEPIKAKVGNVGLDCIDPQSLFARWLFATIEGSIGARKITELTTRDLPFLWICGGVSINRHRVSDFRIEHADLLDLFLTDSSQSNNHSKTCKRSIRNSVARIATTDVVDRERQRQPETPPSADG